MDEIKIPAHQVLSMDSVTEDIHGLRIVFVNVFGISHAAGWTLIDAGLPFSESYIKSWAEKTFHQPPQAIVLTHGHFDHVSAARQLGDEWQVPIYAHQLEFPYLTGRESYPPPNVGAGGGLMSLLSPTYPKGPLNLGSRLRALPAGESELIPELPGWQIVHTPGHTPGHVSFFRTADRALIVGDAFCTTKPESFFEAALAQHAEMHGPPSYFTSDWSTARRSVQRLSELRPNIVAPGHGKPIAGSDVPASLEKLAAAFDEVAVPENSKSAAHAHS